jgi:hypothetical protein
MKIEVLPAPWTHTTRSPPHNLKFDCDHFRNEDPWTTALSRTVTRCSSPFKGEARRGWGHVSRLSSYVSRLARGSRYKLAR